MGRKFYKTVIELKILSEVPIDISLFDHCDWLWESSVTELLIKEDSTTVSGAEMAQLLADQGADPAVFWLNDDGTDMGEDDY